MKNRKPLAGILFCIALLAAYDARAQFGSPADQSGLNGAMLKVFGEIKDFTSDADVHMSDKSGAEGMTMSMGFLMLDGKVRADLDLTRVKSKDLPPEIVANLKQMGMDKMSTVIRPDKKLTIVTYPSLRSYCEVPMTGEAAADIDRKYKIES